MDEQNLKNILSKAEFSDCYDSKEYGTRTLYFDAPKELVADRYPDADAADISIEFPLNEQEACAAYVQFGPVRYSKDGGQTYDWYDVDLPDEHTERLMDMAGKAMRKE